MSSHSIRLELPAHLRTLAGVRGEVHVDVHQPTLRGVLSAIESAYPMLRGTILDPLTGRRRAFLRFFAEETDLSHQSLDEILPASVLEGAEPLLVIGAVAGG